MIQPIAPLESAKEEKEQQRVVAFRASGIVWTSAYKADNEYHAYQPGPKTMEPFPEEDKLEIINGKLRIQAAGIVVFAGIYQTPVPIAGH